MPKENKQNNVQDASQPATEDFSETPKSFDVTVELDSDDLGSSTPTPPAKDRK